MGTLIVIDGLDACGKNTQARLVAQRLRMEGKKVEVISFPNYESQSSGPLKMYLGGELGDDPDKLNPYTCSMLYAVDRAIAFETGLKQLYDSGTILIADRYLSANIIYQGEKIVDLEKKKEYFRWEYETEVEKMGLPREDLTLALTLPIKTSQALMFKRYSGEDKRDIHESNLDFMGKCKENLEVACEYLPTIGYNWKKVDCSASDGSIMSVGDITDLLMFEIAKIIK